MSGKAVKAGNGVAGRGSLGSGLVWPGDVMAVRAALDVAACV